MSRYDEVWRRCRSCGAQLDDAQSMERGYGPTCWGRLSEAEQHSIERRNARGLHISSTERQRLERSVGAGVRARLRARGIEVPKVIDEEAA